MSVVGARIRSRIDLRIESVVADLAQTLRARGLKLATAESCTGGLIAAACTELAGASDWFERGFVTYSNEAKHEMLGVPMEVIEQHGAVSEAVVRSMVEGALRHSRAHVALAVSGVAGPGGGSESKPVGFVWFAWGDAQQLHAQALHWPGDRHAVRMASTAHALEGMRLFLEPRMREP